MKAVIQRVLKADLKVDGELISKIGKGLLIFLGVGKGDTEEDAKKLANKISKLRIFSDENDLLLTLVAKFYLSVNLRFLPTANTAIDQVLLMLKSR